MKIKLPKFIKNVIPAALGMGANFLLPGSGALVGGLAGAAMTSKKNKNISQDAQNYERQAFADELRYGRRNMTNASGATNTNVQDPTTGAWTQNIAFGPEEQKRRVMYNQIAMSRMQNAGGMKLPDLSQGINYGAWKQPTYGSGGGDFGANSLGMGR